MTVQEAIAVVRDYTPGSDLDRLQEAVDKLSASVDSYGSGPGRIIRERAAEGQRILERRGVRSRSSIGASATAPSAAPAPTAAPSGNATLQQIEESALTGIDGSGQLEPIGGFWSGAQARYPDLQSHGIPDMRGPAQPYVDGDDIRNLRSMSDEQLVRLQDLMVATGIAPSVISGELDDNTIGGFRRVLAMSNREGEHYRDTLTRLKTSYDAGDLGEEAEPREPFRYVQQTYLPPDPAQIRNAVRDAAAKIVPDVEISDDEVEYLRSQFERFGRQQFDAEQQADRFGAEAEWRANRDASGEIIETAEAVQQVSAADRFREFFEKRYENTIDRADDAAQEVGRREVTDTNLGNLLQFATGGR